MKISIIIRCYNEEKFIGRLLEGIQQQTETEYEIIAVDSGSTDHTREIIAKYPVTLLSIPKADFSFGRSLNIGCDAASGDILVIVSAHVYPMYQDWLAKIAAPFIDDRIALTYGKQQGDHTTKYSESRVMAKWFPDEPNLDQSHPFCNNANAAVRRSLYQQIRYNEDLTGLEDTDWARKAMLLGYKIAYIPDASVIHVHNESTAQTLNRYRREAIALKRIFPEERFTLWDFAKLFMLNIMNDYKNAFDIRVLTRNLGGVFLFRLVQFWGTYRGFSFDKPVSNKLRDRFYYPDQLTSKKSTANTGETGHPVNYVDDPLESESIRN